MALVQVRKQGGAAIMTIPADIVRELGLAVGSELEVAVVDGAVSARPKAGVKRKRYSLADLLDGATPAVMRKLADETAWARAGDTLGREI